MNFAPNDRFSELLEFLKSGKVDVQQSVTAMPQYKQFISDFPAANLPSLTLDQYCIGTGDNNTFCWWIERGLQQVLGRYMPGTARGHILYKMDDGSIYKHRFLEKLTDVDALKYTLKIQAVIANADPNEDIRWIDDDKVIYQRAGVPPLVTVGDGRKLRLLSCYHPDRVLPISSSDHLGHFLSALGFPEKDIPSIKKPVARMLSLYELYDMARKEISGLTTLAFMKALYSKELGVAPPSKEKQTGKEVGEADKAEDSEDMENDIRSKSEINLILYGPPGTGKTYATIDETLKIIDQQLFDENASTRKPLKDRFDELVESKQVRFVTFHQSFSYEDFVEGLRAVTDDETKQISYNVEDGIFKQICLDAQKQTASYAGLGVSENPRIWKISIVGTYDNDTKKYCYANGEARIGWDSSEISTRSI